jgi:hypothetical protein
MMHRDTVELLIGAAAILLFAVGLIVYQMGLTARHASVGWAVTSAGAGNAQAYPNFFLATVTVWAPSAGASTNGPS